jgi:hypothetical protein
MGKKAEKEVSPGEGFGEKASQSMLLRKVLLGRYQPT